MRVMVVVTEVTMGTRLLKQCGPGRDFLPQTVQLIPGVW